MTPDEYQAVYGPGGARDGDADSADKEDEPKDAPAGAVPSGQTKFSQDDIDAMAATQYGSSHQYNPSDDRISWNPSDDEFDEEEPEDDEDSPDNTAANYTSRDISRGLRRTGKELGKNETLKINGKMYRKVQEETTTDKHPLRESYERIGGK